MNSKSRVRRENLSLSLPPVLLLGAVLSAAFFGLLIGGPLDFAILRRYCLCHPVAVASVSLFFVGIVTLGLKWWQAVTQSSVTGNSAAALRRLIIDGDEIKPAQRPEWLFASWQSLPRAIQEGWFGVRILRTLELQISRGRRNQLEPDLTSLADADADRQHESYGLVRIINWAMPMLGFLGTVLGISSTLGQLDTQMLATQQQEAMNQLTAGLYVAFDTTAIALVLTVFLMFLQFGIGRLEISLLSRIDAECGNGLIGFLAVDPFDAHDTLLSPVREMASELLNTVKQLVEDQSVIWSRSILESQRQWTAWTETASQRIESDLGENIGGALDRHVSSLEKLQDEGNRQLDLRWQQWQTTLSDQARLIHGQQKEAIRQGDTLQKLVDSTTDLRKLEDVIQDSIARLENVNRLEEATLCVGEAVAVLATSLERAGLIRGAPIKPRDARKTSVAGSTTNETTNADKDASVSLPIDPSQRKAA